jgi:hypothetical protein
LGQGRSSPTESHLTYSVGGVAYTSDRWSYVTHGFKRHVVQGMLDALPREVEVHYNPADPQEAYLHTNRTIFGYVMIAFGTVGVLISAALLFG